jgi:hypothetical protein
MSLINTGSVLNYCVKSIENEYDVDEVLVSSGVLVSPEVLVSPDASTEYGDWSEKCP